MIKDFKVIDIAPATSDHERDSQGQEELADLILHIDDLPVGYAVVEMTPNDDTPDETVLSGLVPAWMLEPVQRLQVRFSRGTFGPFASEFLARFLDEPAASAFLAAVRDTAWSDAYLEGAMPRPDTLLRVVPFDRVGAESIALRAEICQGISPVLADIIYFRVGAYVAVVANVGIGIIDSTDTMTLVTRAESRLLKERPGGVLEVAWS
jgi:hypothetical protein